MRELRPVRGKVIVFGIAFFYPLAGVTFQFVHYLLGLRRLGYDVYYVEDSERLVYDPILNDTTEDAARNVREIGQILDAHGFAGRWAYRSHYGQRPCYGLSDSALRELYRDADAFLNVTGAQELREEHLQIPTRLYVESDPFAAQVRVAQGDEYWLNLLGAHTHHFSFGENLGQPDCVAPVTRFQWQPTRQPVALDLWSDDADSTPASTRTSYTTITTWSNKNNDVEYQGVRYLWTKNIAFEEIIDLPRRRPRDQFCLAVKASEDVRRRLTQHGWRLEDSHVISHDLDAYRRFVVRSRGEFTVARHQYVAGRTGWQSDRSVCFLAAGRPVITQDTGFGKFVPTGEGLFAYATIEDIERALDAIESNYLGHCEAARALAREYFDAEKVIGSVMDRAGLR
jgi:hypothetical protein